MSLLQLKSVSKIYNEQVVLSDISLSVRKGEWIGVVGESGSGKSTLLNIIGRYVDADEGTISLKGEKLSRVSDQLLKGYESIKLVHQEYELFPNQTVRENISYALRFYEAAYRKQRVDELLALTRLSEIENRRAKLLSGGEKQRTALAQAIAETPELLLLDEPFAHLDQRNKQTLADAIEALKKTDKLTCIFVTHDAGEAMAWADRLIILKDGIIVQSGSPKEVYEKPANAYVAELTGMVNLLPSDVVDSKTMIRPNFIRTTNREDKAKWKAVITKIRFKGASYEYYCTTSDGQDLVYTKNTRDKELGETVLLTYAQRNLRMVKSLNL
jgi:iron(III) transport system ATP-binding protein